MQLVTVATVEQRDAIAAEANGIYDKTWIGLESADRVPTANNTNFRWLSTGRTPAVAWWGLNEPSFVNSEGVCVEQVCINGSSPIWAGECLTPSTPTPLFPLSPQPPAGCMLAT